MSSKRNFSTPDFSTPDLSTLDFSTINFPTPDVSTPTWGWKVRGWEVWGWKVWGWRVHGWKVRGWKVHGWEVWGWKVWCWILGLKSPGLRCLSTIYYITIVSARNQKNLHVSRSRIKLAYFNWGSPPLNSLKFISHFISKQLININNLQISTFDCMQLWVALLIFFLNLFSTFF